MNISSQITFLYFKNYEAGCHFLNEILGLEEALDVTWAKVYQSTNKSFIGAVNKPDREIQMNDVLISLTVDSVEKYYKDYVGKVENLTPIKFFEFGLKSFFFDGPEGYKFEVQEFTNEEIKQLF